MKRGKNPTRKQKIIIAAAGLQPKNWLVCKENSNTLELEHKISGKYKTIKKELLHEK